MYVCMYVCMCIYIYIWMLYFLALLGNAYGHIYVRCLQPSFFLLNLQMHGRVNVRTYRRVHVSRYRVVDA